MIGPDFRDEQRQPLPSSQIEASDAPEASPAEPSLYQQVLREVRGSRFAEIQNNTQFHEAWLILASILILGGLAFSNNALVGAAIFMLMVSFTTWSWNRLSLFGLHYEREFDHKRAFVGEEIKLTLSLRNQKFLPLTWVTVTDEFSAGLPLDEESLKLNRATQRAEFISFWMPGPFQRLTRHFTLHCHQRGFHRYGPARISTGDAFGFFSCRAVRPQRQTIIVYPKLYPISELGLPAKNPFGEQLSTQRLFEDPLRTSGIRQWQASDTLRRIHWKATARHQELLSRTYDPSEESELLLFLNVTTMRRHWQGHHPELLERAISVAASLAQLATTKRLPIGLIANGRLPGSDQSLRLLPGRSPNQLTTILELLAAVTGFASAPLESLLLQEAPRLPWGATLIVVTAIAYEELLATLLDLDSAGRKIVLFTLAEKPPSPSGRVNHLKIYHLPHLVADLDPDEPVINPTSVKI